LTARDRLRDRSAATLAPKHVWGRAPQPCRLAGALPDRTLWHLCLRREEPRERPNTHRMSPFPIDARQRSRPCTSSRCLPSHETGPSSLARARVERCARWPAGQPPHVFIDVRKLRLDPCSPLFASTSRPRALRTTSADVCFHEHDRGPLEHPEPPESGWDDCFPTESRLSIEGNRRRCAGPGVENTESRRSPPRLLAAETSPRPRSLRAPPVADTAFFPVRSDAERRGCRRRGARLHGARCVRVVRRRISAKKPDVHQPEEPSVVGPPAVRAVAQLLDSELPEGSDSAFFTIAEPARGTLGQDLMARSLDKGEWLDHPVVD
jgi:hypothetical protein